MYKKIAVYGAGGFGREVKMLIDQINQQGIQFEFIGYFDDGLPIGTDLCGFYVLGGLKELNSFNEEIFLVIAVADPKIKMSLRQQMTNKNIKYPRLIHPSCIIGTENVRIGEGSIVCAGTIITIDVRIGENVILNLGCTVGHDTILSDYCSVMPGVNISGEVIIENGVYIGTGAKIINQLKIGEFAIIGAGSVVTKNLPPKCTAIGVPARVIKSD
jgi:sugar O-acyltransferase (sialic acid O-acetyltransferase NeuD family)